MIPTTKKFRIFLIVSILWLAIFIPSTLIKIDIPCCHCGIKAYSENIWCRMISGFSMDFLHEYCVDEWCKDNETGFVIDQFGYRHSPQNWEKIRAVERKE